MPAPPFYTGHTGRLLRRVASTPCGAALRPGGLKLSAEGLAAAGFRPGARILDVGAGEMATLNFLRQQGFAAWGVDLAAPGGHLNERAGENSPGHFIRGDMQALPFASGALDGVFCECALSLAADKAGALREIARVLKPGGRLVLSDLIRPDGPNALCRTAAAPETAIPESEPADSCLAGAPSRYELLALLSNSGCKPFYEADHTRALAELAARLVLHAEPGEPAAPARPAAPGAHAFKPSYLLLVAQKENTP